MIEIVEAEEKHVPAVGRLWLEFMEFSQDIDPIFAPRDGTVMIFEEEYLRPAMKSENDLVLAALDNGQVVGYSYSKIIEPGNLVKRKKYGYVHDMFINTSYRRMGIGEKMFDEILKWFRSKDIDRVELGVIVKNQVAYSFWKKHGFIDYMHTLSRQI